MLSEQEIAELSKPNDKTEIFAQVSQKLADKNEEAKKVRTLIEAHEQQIMELKDFLRRIEEDEMPTLMDELGVSKIVLTNGTPITVDTSLHVTIPAMMKNDAHVWLRDNGEGGIIKNELNIKFNKGEDNQVGHVKALVEEMGLHYDQKESVHSSTLKAWVKEQMKAGRELPSHLFEVYIKRIVNTK